MVRLTEGSSLKGTIFNLANTILGAGILSLPYAAENTGIVTAVLMLIGISLLQNLSAWMLLVGVDTTKEISFAVVAEVLYSRWLGIMVDSMVLLCNFGVLTSYVVILGDLIPSFMTYVHAPSAMQNRTYLLLATAGVLLLPLSSLRKMGLLAFASMGCLMAIGLFVVVVILLGLDVIHVDHTGDSPVPLFNTDLKTVLTQFPVMLFAYNCNMNVPILYGELRRQHLSTGSKFKSKRGKMMTALFTSVSVCCFFYCIAAVMGVRAFRQNVQPNIFKNFNAGLFGFAPYLKASYAFVLSFSYPVMCFSCVASFHRLLWHVQTACRRRPGQAQEVEEGTSHNGVREVLNQSELSNPSPTANNAEHCLRRPSALSDVSNPSQTAEEDAAWTPSVHAEADIAPPESANWVRQVEVIFIVGSTTTLGIIFPHLNTVLGLTGGVCGSFLSFVFPGLFFYKSSQLGQRGGPSQALGLIMFFFGLICTVLSVVLVLQEPSS